MSNEEIFNEVTEVARKRREEQLKEYYEDSMVGKCYCLHDRCARSIKVSRIDDYDDDFIHYTYSKINLTSKTIEDGVQSQCPINAILGYEISTDLYNNIVEEINSTQNEVDRFIMNEYYLTTEML